MIASHARPSRGRILAAIDASPYARSVGHYAAWTASRLEAPLEFVHVLDRHPETASSIDLSGNLGTEGHEGLLDELASVDERRSKLAHERGRLLLEDAKERAMAAGVPEPSGRMRNGALVETLVDLEGDVRLFVVGKRGRHAQLAKGHLGGNLERVVRSVHRALLVVPSQFREIRRFAIAFDGSATTRNGVDRIIASPLLRGLPCHVVMAGTDTAEHRAQLDWARTKLQAAGFLVDAALVSGVADAVLETYVRTHAIDLLVMGAYGHSRIRHLIVGSTTTTVLRTCDVPVLLLR